MTVSIRLCVCLVVLTACIQAVDPVLIPIELALDINRTGGPPPTRVSTVTVEGLPFRQAQRLQVQGAGDKNWSVLLASLNTEPVAKGDTLVLAVWLRSLDESASPTVYAYFQKAATPWTRSVFEPWKPRPVWHLHQVVFRSKGAYAPREAALGLACGSGPMTIEVGPAELRNFRGADPSATGVPNSNQEP
jgi:hypothetical protein